MLTVTILINGQPIYARTAVNMDTKLADGRTLYKLDNGNGLYHQPNDGAVVLAKKMLDTITEDLQTNAYIQEFHKVRHGHPTGPPRMAPDAQTPPNTHQDTIDALEARVGSLESRLLALSVAVAGLLKRKVPNAAKLSPARRSAIAKKAAETKWIKRNLGQRRRPVST